MAKLQHPIGVSLVMQMIDRILQIEKGKHVDVKGIGLYPSEIHLMLHIADQEATNLTRIAERLGITKGALSQTLGRLERKRMLIKSKNPRAKNELTVSFTAEGRHALNRFRALRASVEARYDRLLAEFDEHELAVVEHFLTRMNQSIGGRR
jgi:DNA-binding MarR family transcriptional regulator